MKMLFMVLWLLVSMLLPTVAFAADSPIPCSTGCHPFSLKGEIEGINPASLPYQYNGYNYLISGVFNGAGGLYIDVLKVAMAYRADHEAGLL